LRPRIEVGDDHLVAGLQRPRGDEILTAVGVAHGLAIGESGIDGQAA
jgi:hypothetical protein